MYSRSLLDPTAYIFTQSCLCVTPGTVWYLLDICLWRNYPVLSLSNTTHCIYTHTWGKAVVYQAQILARCFPNGISIITFISSPIYSIGGGRRTKISPIRGNAETGPFHQPAPFTCCSWPRAACHCPCTVPLPLHRATPWHRAPQPGAGVEPWGPTSSSHPLAHPLPAPGAPFSSTLRASASHCARVPAPELPPLPNHPPPNTTNLRVSSLT